MHPRLIFSTRIAPGDTTSTGIKKILGRSAANLRSKSSHSIAFQSKPIIEVVGQRSVQPIQVCVERSGVKANVLVTDAKLKAIILAVPVVKLGLRRQGGLGCGIRDRRGHGVAIHSRNKLNALTGGGESGDAVPLRHIEVKRGVLRCGKAGAS